MDPGVQTLRRLWIDVALSHDAPERGLNVLTGTTEPVVEIEMPERGVKIVAPQQPNHSPAEPDAFRIAGRPADLSGGFGEFVDAALGLLGGVALLPRLCRLVARLGVARLGCRWQWSQRKERRTQGNG